MTLELDRLAAEIPAFVESYREALERREAGLGRAEVALDAWAADPAGVDERLRGALRGGSRPFATSTYEPPDAAFRSPEWQPVTVVAADGSSIEPDRFAPVQCFVINVGVVVFPYGTGDAVAMHSLADLGPRNEAEVDDGGGDIPNQGWGVNLRRDVAELEAVAGAALGTSGPCVALLDGTLLPWDLKSPQIAADLRAHLGGRTLAALEAVHAAPGEPAIAAYVSGSRASDVSNSLSALADGAVPAISDGHLFARRLREGERSALFRAESGRVERVERDLGDYSVWFFYLRVGGDVARVEMPAWVGEDPERVTRLHAALIDQCARCDGYPRALQEAHELAVITGGDREAFARLLESESARFGLEPVLNGKAASKRRRGL